MRCCVLLLKLIVCRYTIDEMIPRTFGSFVSCAMQVTSTIVVISLSSPIFLAAVVPLGLLFYLIQR